MRLASPKTDDVLTHLGVTPGMVEAAECVLDDPEIRDRWESGSLSNRDLTRTMLCNAMAHETAPSSLAFPSSRASLGTEPNIGEDR